MATAFEQTMNSMAATRPADKALTDRVQARFAQLGRVGATWLKFGYALAVHITFHR